MSDGAHHHWKAGLGGTYLGAQDLWVPSKGSYAEVRVRIDAAYRETVTIPGGKKEPKTVLRLVGVRTGKPLPPMIVSNLSGSTINRMFNDPTLEGWIGREITVYVRRGVSTNRGSGDVITVRDESGSKRLRDELRAAMPPPLDDDDFSTDPPGGNDAPTQ